MEGLSKDFKFSTRNLDERVAWHTMISCQKEVRTLAWCGGILRQEDGVITDVKGANWQPSTAAQAALSMVIY